MDSPVTMPAVLPAPQIDALSRPHWDGLAAGELRFQRCPSCANAWLPAREQCPACLAPEPVWEKASGAATLISWVTYHVAFNEAFRDRLPYVVAAGGDNHRQTFPRLALQRRQNERTRRARSQPAHGHHARTAAHLRQQARQLLALQHAPQRALHRRTFLHSATHLN